jgi:hypothetical protein
MQVKASSSQHKSIASSLIENLAVLILKTRLARYDEVKVKVDASPLGLIQGKIDGVTIQGTDWASPVALTSRSLYFSLGLTQIDYTALLMERRISLRSPKPQGQARILFSPNDFGNFLRHPLFQAATKRAVQGGPFNFDGSSVSIEEGSVLFTGTWRGETYDLCLMPNQPEEGEKKVRLTARGRRSKEKDAIVSSDLASFFNELLIDLQGVQLRFLSMDVIRSSSSDRQDPLLLEMKLKASLVEVPPIDVEF